MKLNEFWQAIKDARDGKPLGLSEEEFELFSAIENLGIEQTKFIFKCWKGGYEECKQNMVSHKAGVLPRTKLKELIEELTALSLPPAPELREGVAKVLLKARIYYPEQADRPTICYGFNAMFVNEITSELLSLFQSAQAEAVRQLKEKVAVLFWFDE